jgi:hypothetical protein
MTYPFEPTLAEIAERLRERTAPLAPNDERYGYAHAYLCGAMGAVLVEVAEVFDPEGDIPPMAPLLDPDLCPGWALPWLAQLVGVALPAGISDDDARTLIHHVSGFQRGTPAALRAAAGLFLTGNKSVYFRERDANAADPPYTLEVVTLTGETPDPAATLTALMAQKPGGLVLTYRTVEGQDWQAVSESGKTWRSARAAYATWRDLRDNAEV